VSDPRAIWPLRKEHVLLRSRVLRSMRDFFEEQGFAEVETPVRIPCPANEFHIDAPPSGDWYLRTSPELHMKRLLAAGLPRVYQVGACFREGESGHRHSAEFTMLEWYRAEVASDAIMGDAISLLRKVVRDVTGGSEIRFAGHVVELADDWHILSVRDVFQEFAGWDPVAHYDPERFDADMVAKVEPSLPADRPVILQDYPAGAAALARVRQAGDDFVAERWELYIAGVELANAFTELTDPGEQRERFRQCAADRAAAGRIAYPVDQAFLAALAWIPDCAGIALGVDRLVMLLAGAEDIVQVRFVE
jgi:lysyl-tRNA synthetase class 2